MNNKISTMLHSAGRNANPVGWAATGLVTLALGMATGGHAADENGAGVKQGRADYLTYCASCHGANGEGDGPVSGSLKNRPPNLTYLKQQEMSGEFPQKRVMEIVQGNPDYAMNYRTHGPADMPVWGRELTKDSSDRESIAKARIRNLVEYLESIQK
ncbi:MAG: cytochrome c [Pseudomonadales bacterium]|nr:cytochrome c [Pseudomonadales bacterium]